MHIGTFSHEESWDAACRELAELVEHRHYRLEVLLRRISLVASGGAMMASTCSLHRDLRPADAFRRFVNRAHDPDSRAMASHPKVGVGYNAQHQLTTQFVASSCTRERARYERRSPPRAG